jgi:hypothetical protein
LANLQLVDSKPGESSDDLHSRSARRGAAVTYGGYALLLAFGLLQGLVGSFQYSRGPAPVAAIGFALLITLTCVLGAWGMHAATGAVLPAVGWFIPTVLLTTGTQGGSVVITDTAAGKWFLFGGALCVIAACVFSALRWSRSRARRPAAGSRRSWPRP